MDSLHDPKVTLANTYVFHVREDMLCDPNSTVINIAFVTTVHEACVVVVKTFTAYYPVLCRVVCLDRRLPNGVDNLLD